MLIESIKNIFFDLRDYINSSEFLEQAREKKKYFVRKRLLPFTRVILFIINFRVNSTQAELNQFFEHVYSTENHPTKGAFFRARQKIKQDAIRILLEKSADFFYKQKSLVKKWQGFRLVAADGTSVNIPLTGDKIKDKKLIEHFGVVKNSNIDTTVIEGQGEILYDILNNIVISGYLGTYPANERLNLLKLIDKLGEGDLLLLDRGYPASWLFYILKYKGINFVCRIPKNYSTETNNFLASKESDKIITLDIKKEAKEKYPELDLPKRKVKIRLIKIKLADGSIEVLATSLINKKKYKKTFFKELYFGRWKIEGLMNVLKNKLQMENFSGKTEKVILQDFYAKLFQKNLYAFVNIEAEQEIKEEKQNLKHEYTTNENIGYSILKNKVIKIFIESIDKIFKILRKIIRSIKRQIEPIRPDRKYPRKKKISTKSTRISYATRTAF